MKALTLAVLSVFFLTSTTGCATRRVVEENGPVIVAQATMLGVITALDTTKTSKDEAVRIGRYLVDARGIITNGDVPANALDDVANLINNKVSNPMVVAAIQFGVELIKNNIQIPVDGWLSDKVRVWVLAMLDGAIDGCDMYVRGIGVAGSLPPDSRYWVSFK